jgi:hypothetical protein
MFENIWPKKETLEDSSKKNPAFESLKAALPESLQEEFQNLGEKVSSMGTGMDGREIESDILPSEDQLALRRYEDLIRIAETNLDKNKDALV